MKRTIVVLIAGLALLTGSRQALAHHSFSAEYDSTQKVEITGVVTEFVWRNPHSFMKMDVTDKDGATKTWTLEWGSISSLTQYSISRTSIKPGDKIIVSGQAARDPAAPRMLIETVKRPADGWEWKGRVQ
jgi:uncharacterized protein DUF6152